MELVMILLLRGSVLILLNVTNFTHSYARKAKTATKIARWSICQFVQIFTTINVYLLTSARKDNTIPQHGYARVLKNTVIVCGIIANTTTLKKHKSLNLNLNLKRPFRYRFTKKNRQSS
jgi:hypothetical protein